MTKQYRQANVSRRNLLKLSAGAIGAGVLTAGIGGNLVSAGKASAQNKKEITPDAALKELLDGNDRFVKARRRNPNMIDS